MIPGFVTVPELANILRARGLAIPANTIRYWIYQRKIMAHQFGKRGLWLLPSAALDALDGIGGDIDDREQVKAALGYQRLWPIP